MTKRNEFMPFLLPVEAAAEKIFRAIRKKKSRFIFPWQMRLLVGVLRFLPDSLYDALMSLRYRKGVFQ